MIPADISKLLLNPNTPWQISPDVASRLQGSENRFKTTVLVSTDPESKFVMSYYMADKPVGYSIGRITCISNRTLKMGFIAHLTFIEEEAKKFYPSWRTEEGVDQKMGAINQWKESTKSFSPLQITIDQEQEVLKLAQVLPLWHATSSEKSQSICQSGFTYFGKHSFFKGQAAPGSTDIGFFGSGIYFTNSARYAAKYSHSTLMLSWVSMREPYPVVNDKPHPHKGTEMSVLEGKGAYQNYDSHLIPVAPIDPDDPNCINYFPCYKDQKAECNEIVVFQKAQALPCFIIELQADIIHAPSTVYSFSMCYAACQAGNLSQIKIWIKENRKRLEEEAANGENFFYAAALSNQIDVLQWLDNESPHLFKKCRKDGWTLMHAAASQGHTRIVGWLHSKDSKMCVSTVNGLSPLHIAAFSEQAEVVQLFLKEILDNIGLLEEIVQRPCVKTLQLLLEHGLSPNLANNFKQTLLHLAAYKGQSENVALLLSKGAFMNAQDLSKKTPLYLAAVQGHLSTVVYLIEQGADVTICAIEGDTILHVAAFYGYTPLLQVLLEKDHIKKLLHLPDHDGKQPIHKAVWGTPKPDVVQLLLDHGAKPNATNKFGYTPLHWSAKHGHVSSVEILVKAGASLEVANENHDLPFDLAVRWGQDAVVDHFLGTKQHIKIDQLPKDVEAYYCKQLLQAKRENHFEEQVFYLGKLSDLYIQNKNWVQGAKILNSALAILQKNLKNPLFEQYLFARLERIEALFLESERFKIANQHRGSILKYRACLKNIRQEYILQFEKKESITKILNGLTTSYKKLLSTLILDAQEMIGDPPVAWSCIGMGSMARDEMCPYSDIEFAFLIEEKTEKTLAYFRTLSKLLELKIINLGETKFPVFGESEKSPTSSGFSMDSGGNTPLGKPEFYELIDTPEGLAQFQSVQWMKGDIIVTNALSSVCHVSGEQKLVVEYEKFKEKNLNAAEGVLLFKGTMFCEKLAMELLKGNLHEFRPDLSKEKEENSEFGIKKELYRPFQSILGSLKLFYRLRENQTVKIIDKLLQEKVISSEGSKNLKRALEQVLRLRFEAHIFYQNEEEILFHIKENKPRDPHTLYLDENYLKPLHDIYMVLIPFYHCGKEFLHTKNKKAFNKASLYDDSPTVQGTAFVKTLQYAKAQAAYQQAISLNPNNLDALFELSTIEKILGRSKDALPRGLKALELAVKQYGENHTQVAVGHNEIGLVYNDLGEYKKALEHCQKSLNIWLHFFGENHPDVAMSYNDIGAIHINLGEYKKALEHYQKALKIRLQSSGENNPQVAKNYNNIGVVYEKLREYNKALEHYQKALNIGLQVLDKNHPDVATGYNNIGSIYINLGEYKKGLEYHQKSLKICLETFGENHPNVARSYNNIGGLYHVLGDYEKELEHYQKSLKIRQQVLGENHSDVALSYNNIGAVYSDLGDFKKALEYGEKALKIRLQVFDGNHPDVVQSYNNIAFFYDTLGEFEKAVEYHQKTLKVRLHVLGENHFDTALSYNNIGVLYKNCGEYEKALEYYKKSLKICLQVYQKNHPNIESLLKNLIACAKHISPSQIKTLLELSVLCTQTLGTQHALAQELAQLMK